MVFMTEKFFMWYLVTPGRGENLFLWSPKKRWNPIIWNENWFAFLRATAWILPWNCDGGFPRMRLQMEALIILMSWKEQRMWTFFFPIRHTLLLSVYFMPGVVLLFYHLQIFTKFFYNDFYFFHYSWFTMFYQFSTVQQGDPVIHTCIHSFFSQYHAPS